MKTGAPLDDAAARLLARSGARAVATPTRQRLWRLLANLGLVAGSVAIVFGSAEIVASFFVPNPLVWKYPQEAYVQDPHLLHRLKPNQTAFTHSFPVVTNSYGLRNEEISRRPVAGTSRVLCLGDSLTFGVGVAFADAYPKRLQAALNAAGRGRHEVINAGVPAYDTWQEITYLREEGWRFEPTLVILGFYANDIVPRPSTIPTGTAGAERKARPDAANAAVYILKRSRVLLLMKDRVTRLLNRIAPSPAVLHQESLLRGTSNEQVEAGFRELDASFAELAALSREHGFATLVVLFPMAEQIVGRYPDAVYPARVEALARRHGLPTLDLTPAFAEHYTGFSSLFIDWDGHPNARAHALAAQKIAEYLTVHGDLSVLGEPARR